MCTTNIEDPNVMEARKEIQDRKDREDHKIAHAVEEELHKTKEFMKERKEDLEEAKEKEVADMFKSGKRDSHLDE